MLAGGAGALRAGPGIPLQIIAAVETNVVLISFPRLAIGPSRPGVCIGEGVRIGESSSVPRADRTDVRSRIVLAPMVSRLASARASIPRSSGETLAGSDSGSGRYKPAKTMPLVLFGKVCGIVGAQVIQRRARPRWSAVSAPRRRAAPS